MARQLTLMTYKQIQEQRKYENYIMHIKLDAYYNRKILVSQALAHIYEEFSFVNLYIFLNPVSFSLSFSKKSWKKTKK